jgi:NADH:ubiquinone oxidoreductase subunit 6 (subunit J)
MVIDLNHVVGIILMLLLAGAVFGLLYFLIHYVGRKFPGEGAQLFVTIADIVLVVLGVLFIIGVILTLAGAGPQFQWGAEAPGKVR